MTHAVMLSYPRSGKCWLMYCVEHILGCESASWREAIKFVNKSVIVKCHLSNLIEKSYSGNKLILLVRNYKEAITRHRQLSGGSNFRGTCEHGDYWANIVLFHEWDAPKHIVYYEDLILNPAATISNLCHFLGDNAAKLDNFMRKYEEHQKKSLKLRKKLVVTLGDKDKLLYHSKDLKEEEVKEWDAQMRDLDPYIYDLYLSRYAHVTESENEDVDNSR